MFARLITRLTARFAARRTLHGLLARKDDHLLRDIGIDPSDARTVLMGGTAPWLDRGEAADTVKPRVLPCDLA